LIGTAFFSQRYLNNGDRVESFRHIVAGESDRFSSAFRQAITCAPRHLAQLPRILIKAEEAHEVADAILVDPPGTEVRDVGEPFRLGQNVGESVEGAPLEHWGTWGERDEHLVGTGIHVLGHWEVSYWQGGYCTILLAKE
jgi:hypothetical protein